MHFLTSLIVRTSNISKNKTIWFLFCFHKSYCNPTFVTIVFICFSLYIALFTKMIIFLFVNFWFAVVTSQLAIYLLIFRTSFTKVSFIWILTFLTNHRSFIIWIECFRTHLTIFETLNYLKTIMTFKTFFTFSLFIV